MNRALLVLLLVLVSFGFAYAATYPQYSSENKYVTDTAGIITPEWKAQITSLCAEIEKNTTAQIAVVTVNSTEGIPIEEYSLHIAETWGIGEKEKDNGILILIAVNDRAYRIEVGYGLEGVLNDAKVGRIGRNFFVENFQAGEYGQGVYLAVDAIGKEIRGEPTALSDTQQVPTEMIIFFVVFIVMFLAPIIFGLILSKFGKKTSTGQWLLWGMLFNSMGRGRGGFGGFGGSGSGGFGGGSFGGGGASGRW